jgi:hypothetical protein
MLDDPTVIMKKFKRAVTDSETEVRYDVAAKPGCRNLLDILAAATGRTPEGRRRVHPVRAAQGRRRRGGRRAARADPGALPRADRRPAELARLLQIGSAEQGPCRRVGHPRARLRRHRPRPRLTTLVLVGADAAAPGRNPGSSSGGPPDPDHLVGVPGARVARRRTALRARRHGDRRPPRHRAARRSRVAATVLSFVFAGANFLTYGTTERVARGSAPATRGRRQRRRPGAVARRPGRRAGRVLLGVPHARCRVFGPTARSSGTRTRTCRSARSASRSSSSPSPRRACCGARPTTSTPLWVLLAPTSPTS